MKVKRKMYFNNTKETSLDYFLEVCEEQFFEPSKEAQETAMFAGYEICVDVEWDLETGNCKILGNAK